MSTVGQIEKRTQARVVRLFQDQLGYDYLGNWIDRDGNRNIETAFLRSYLEAKGYDPALITKAIAHLTKVATDQSRSLYDINRSVYDLMRYGVKVKADVGEQTQTVWLIDWKNAAANHFAIAEEVAVKAGTSDGKTFGKRPGRGDLCERHSTGRAGIETLDRVGVRRHPPEPRQPKADVHSAVLHHHADDHGGQ